MKRNEFWIISRHLDKFPNHKKIISDFASANQLDEILLDLDKLSLDYHNDLVNIFFDAGKSESLKGLFFNFKGLNPENARRILKI